MSAFEVNMGTAKIRVIFEYEFRRGTNAAETARNVNAVFEEDTVNEHTVHFWLNRFRSGNWDLKNEPQGRPATKGCYEVIVEYLEGNIDILIGIALGTAFLPLIGTFLSCFLANYIKRSKYDAVN